MAKAAKCEAAAPGRKVSHRLETELEASNADALIVSRSRIGGNKPQTPDTPKGKLPSCPSCDLVILQILYAQLFNKLTISLEFMPCIQAK